MIYSIRNYTEPENGTSCAFSIFFIFNESRCRRLYRARARCSRVFECHQMVFIVATDRRLGLRSLRRQQLSGWLTSTVNACTRPASGRLGISPIYEYILSVPLGGTTCISDRNGQPTRLTGLNTPLCVRFPTTPRARPRVTLDHRGLEIIDLGGSQPDRDHACS